MELSDCIFTANCIRPTCDKSCPVLAETYHLLQSINKISMDSEVFHASDSEIHKSLSILEKNKGKFGVVISSNTVHTSTMLTYCAICKNWKGSQLHCSVYNLKYSQYIENLKKSWSSGESEDLEMIKIWNNSAKVLVISNIDYTNFRNFECQTLLELIQQRSANSEYTTIIVSPPLSNLIGDNGAFFSRLMEVMKKAVA